MRYWDASALVPLFLEEQKSGGMTDLAQEDRSIISWWGTPIECFSAICRLKRKNKITEADFQKARVDFDELMRTIDVIPPSESLKERALRLLLLHPLRTGDALQLASALHWTQNRTQGAGFVTLDDRLRVAALTEGFSVFP